jgi:hypothetical protein
MIGQCSEHKQLNGVPAALPVVMLIYCVHLTCAAGTTTWGRSDWNPQRLPRSLGQLILTKLAQRKIHTRPSEPQNFSFVVVW